MRRRPSARRRCSQRVSGEPPLYYALATVVALSRIHTKIHHASDVAGGVAIGVALGHLARRMVPLQPSGTARTNTEECSS